MKYDAFKKAVDRIIEDEDEPPDENESEGITMGGM